MLGAKGAASSAPTPASAAISASFAGIVVILCRKNKKPADACRASGLMSAAIAVRASHTAAGTVSRDDGGGYDAPAAVS
jgi:hypothetical protein